MTKLTHTCACPAHSFDRSWFDQTTEAVANVVADATHATRKFGSPARVYAMTHSRIDSPCNWQDNVTANIAHFWHPSLVARFNLHPVVELMLAYRPADVQQLVLEWPHVSETDPNQLAYTRDDSKGIADVQTTTSVGKYVARHWPLLPDHIRRDVCSLYTADECFFVEASVKAFGKIVDTGPTSCMQSGWNGRQRGWEIHPYSVYDPALGWGMAARRSNGQIDGRALTYTFTDKHKIFVRAYSRNEKGYSQGDVALSSWLVSQGFTKACSWDGAVIARVEDMHGNLVAPYIDGDAQNLQSCSSKTFTIVEDRGEYQCNNTDGTADCYEDNSIGNCADCGCGISEDDDYRHTGRHEDHLVCGGCEDNYAYVEGCDSRGRTTEYYVHDDNVTRVNDESYDSDNLPSNIMQLEDGDYIDTESDDYCVIDDEYYLCDDYRVVYCESDSEHHLKDNCWQCAESDEWYPDAVDYELVEGAKYHPDSLEAMRDEQQVAPLFPEPAWPFTNPAVSLDELVLVAA